MCVFFLIGIYKAYTQIGQIPLKITNTKQLLIFFQSLITVFLQGKRPISGQFKDPFWSGVFLKNMIDRQCHVSFRCTT